MIKLLFKIKLRDNERNFVRPWAKT